MKNKTELYNKPLLSMEDENQNILQGEEISNTQGVKTINNIKSVIIRCLVISFGAIFTGYNLGSYSFVQPTMNYVLQNDSSYIAGTCNALVSLGIAVGSMFSNHLLNTVLKKRRLFMLMADLIGMASSVLQLFPSMPTLFIGRFLGGVVAGFNFLICPVYIKEYVPLDWLGTCISIYSNSVNAGVMLSYIVGFSLSEKVQDNVPYIWRLNLAFPIIFCIFRAVLILTVYKVDTPAYYLEFKDENLTKLALEQTHNPQIIDKKLQEYKILLEQIEQTKVSLINLFKPKYRKRLAMAIFSSSSEALTGLMIFTAYSWMIYQTVVGQKTSLGLSVTQVGVQMICMAFLGKIIRKYGRKQIMVTVLIFNLLSQIGQTFASYMILQGYNNAFFTFLTIFCLQAYYACLGIGISCVAFLIVVDLVPQSGISIANGFMALFNCIYSFGFPVLIDYIPMWQALAILCVCDLILLIVFKFWVVETKDLDENQLDKIFNPEKKVV